MAHKIVKIRMEVDLSGESDMGIQSLEDAVDQVKGWLSRRPLPRCVQRCDVRYRTTEVKPRPGRPPRNQTDVIRVL